MMSLVQNGCCLILACPWCSTIKIRVCGAVCNNHILYLFFIYLPWYNFLHFLCCPLSNQEFDNADAEECSGGSSPVQEDSLSSCPSLPEVYTLPVRDRPNCPALQDGAGKTPSVTTAWLTRSFVQSSFQRYKARLEWKLVYLPTRPQMLCVWADSIRLTVPPLRTSRARRPFVPAGIVLLNKLCSETVESLHV